MFSLLVCFTLLLLAARFDFVESALPCTSPLRARYPQHFLHCPKCSYTQWTTWSVVIPVVIKTENACDSDKAKKYERMRTPLPGAVCEDALQRNITYKCKYTLKDVHGIKYIFLHVLFLLIFIYLAGVPTLRQQAELFIRSLRLGANADEPTDNPTTQPTPRTTKPPYCLRRKKRFADMNTDTGLALPVPQGTAICTTPPLFTLRTTAPPSITVQTQSPYRGRRQVPIPAGSHYCPNLTEQANNRICQNVCSRGMQVRQ